MAACDMALIMLEGGWRGGQLVCVTSSYLGRITPINGTLEDLDEDVPVHIKVCYAVLFRRHGENTL